MLAGTAPEDEGQDRCDARQTLGARAEACATVLGQDPSTIPTIYSYSAVLPSI